MSLHILDVAENGIRAGAKLIKIVVDENTGDDLLTIVIEDDGRGMSPDFLGKVLDPFVTTRTTRQVGLGLSMFQQSAEESEGSFKIQSAPGVGTKVTATMRHSHIDRKPMGDMASTILTLIEGNPDVDFFYNHRKGAAEYVLDTRTIRAELGDVPINIPQVVSLLQSDLSDGLKELNGIS